MYHLTDISAYNFMSFETVSCNFENKCYVIKGDNKDNDGQQSNGSGKTSLLEIIAVTLLGQSLTDRDLKQCINRYGNDNYFITTIVLSNQKDVVMIARKVYSNKNSQELAIQVNGKPVKELPTKAGVEHGVDLRKGNEWILSTLLDITKDDLLNYFLISDKHYKGFLGSGNQEKINVISRFSNATKIDEVIERLDDQKGDCNKEISNLEMHIQGYNGQIEGLLYSVSDEARQKFENEKEDRKQKLLPRVEQLETQLNNLNEELSILGQSQFECEEFYGRYNTEQIAEMDRQKRELHSISNEINHLIGRLNIELKNKIICPACNHEFVVDSEQSIPELQQELEQSKQDLTSIEEDEKKIIDEIEGQKLLMQIDADIERISTQVESLLKTYESIQEQLRSISDQQFQSGDIDQKIAALRGMVEANEIKISGITKQQSQIQEWIERFERFKYFLINKPIAIICNQTNQILKQIGSEYSISIEGFKQLKSGDLRAELTPVVYIKGIESQSYTSFSAGEKTRLDLACDVAIQNMINSTSKGGLNFYFSDEKISALDSKGIENVAKSFNDLGKTILLVSHSGSDLNYVNQIMIRKENKKSILI